MGMALSNEDKVAERRTRRAAARQGLRLRRSSSRDQRARDYGRYWLHDDETGTTVCGGRWGVDLTEAAAYLDHEHDEADDEDDTAA